MSHYDEEYEKAILEASVNIRNETKQDGSIHIKTNEDADEYINSLKSAHIVGHISEADLLESIDQYKAHTNLITDPWHHLYMGFDDPEFDRMLDDIRNEREVVKPRAKLKNGEWVLK